SMCSRTRSSGARATSCIMTPIFLRVATFSGESPNSRALPESGWCNPSSREMAVDLPAPFGPSTASSSAGRTCNSKLSRATTVAKRLLTPDSSASESGFILCSFLRCARYTLSAYATGSSYVRQIFWTLNLHHEKPRQMLGSRILLAHAAQEFPAIHDYRNTKTDPRPGQADHDGSIDDQSDANILRRVFDAIGKDHQRLRRATGRSHGVEEQLDQNEKEDIVEQLTGEWKPFPFGLSEADGGAKKPGHSQQHDGHVERMQHRRCFQKGRRRSKNQHRILRHEQQPGQAHKREGKIANGVSE